MCDTKSRRLSKWTTLRAAAMLVTVMVLMLLQCAAAQDCEPVDHDTYCDDIESDCGTYSDGCDGSIYCVSVTLSPYAYAACCIGLLYSDVPLGNYFSVYERNISTQRCIL
jgi:hypothetical protein